jgi:hypothetical protein
MYNSSNPAFLAAQKMQKSTKSAAESRSPLLVMLTMAEVMMSNFS